MFLTGVNDNKLGKAIFMLEAMDDLHLFLLYFR